MTHLTPQAAGSAQLALALPVAAEAASPPFSYANNADELPSIAYCTTPEEAKALVAEMLEDAAGRPLGLDIETTPTPGETARLADLELRQAANKGAIKAAKKAHAPEAELSTLKAEDKLLVAHIKYARTAALDPHRSRIRLLQIYGGGDRVAVLDLDRTGKGVLGLMSGLDIVAHNAAFELSFLEHAGVDLGEIHCTMQAARLTLGERSMSLVAAAAAHLGLELDKAEQTSDWSAHELSRAQLEYAALDAVLCSRLAERVFQALALQAPAYEIQMGATPAVVRMIHRGVHLDRAAHAAMLEDYVAKRNAAVEAYRTACRQIGFLALAENVPQTPASKRSVLGALLTSDELAEWKRTPKSGELSTSRSELRRAAHYPPLAALAELSRIDKILSAFGPTLTAFISPVTGRIHARYRVASTASGRASCSGPNVQQTPRGDFRKLFRAAPGHKFVGADFSSMELRAAAHISDDLVMAEAFRAGKDLHRITASRMLGKPEEEITPEERQGAKAVNFGSIYGIGAAGLVATAWDDYGIVLSKDEAEQWINTARRTYPTLAEWRYTHYRHCESAGQIVIGKHAKLGVGRLYPLSRLPPAARNGYTRCCNFPVQGTCADASMLALEAIDRALFDAGIEGGPVLWLHDEIILEIPEADAERAKEMLETAMREAFAETFPGAPLDGLVEAHIAENWAALKEGERESEGEETEDEIKYEIETKIEEIERAFASEIDEAPLKEGLAGNGAPAVPQAPPAVPQELPGSRDSLCDIAPTRFQRLDQDGYFTVDADWIIPALCRAVAVEGPILEPCAGKGHMVVELRALGFTVEASDLCAHADPLITDITIGADVFARTSLSGFRFLITNLPYDEQNDILAHLLPIAARDGCPLATLGRSEWSSAKARAALVQENPHFAGEVRLTKRPVWFRPARASPRHWFSWFVWSPAPRAPGVDAFLRFAG